MQLQSHVKWSHIATEYKSTPQMSTQEWRLRSHILYYNGTKTAKGPKLISWMHNGHSVCIIDTLYLVWNTKDQSVKKAKDKSWLKQNMLRSGYKKLIFPLLKSYNRKQGKAFEDSKTKLQVTRVNPSELIKKCWNENKTNPIVLGHAPPSIIFPPRALVSLELPM